MKVTEADLKRIIDVTEDIKAQNYIPAKKALLTVIIENLNEREKELFAFFVYICLFNSKLKAVNADRYWFTLGKEANKVTFEDFLKLLRRYENINITPSREVALVKFLDLCDRQHRDFFLSVLSKEWINSFPVVELQKYLPIDSISSVDIYGDIAYLKTSFSDLNYPVVVRSIPAGKFKTYLFRKEPNFMSLQVKEADTFEPTLITENIRLEANLSVTPRYSIGGLTDGEGYYPFDYFDENCDVTEYVNRAEGLARHLDRSVLIATDSSNVSVSYDETDICNAIVDVVRESNWSDLLVTDTDSLRSGRMFKVTCRIATGIIEEVWLSDGKAKGFIIWFNGEKRNCTYKFVGKDSALLGSSASLSGKVLDFYYLTLGTTEYLIGKSILWGHAKWRKKKLRGTEIELTKCVLCGDDSHDHSSHGMCKPCERNLGYYLTKYGANTWVTPSPQMQTKRWRNSWKYNALNNVAYSYKGHLLEANEGGEWKFNKGD